MGRPIDDNYSRNQCALLIRIDGDELYVPLNFNMRAEEIRDIYPYLLDMFNNPAPNPSLKFQKDDAEGKYKNLTEKERRKLLLDVKKLSMLWYNHAEESLLAIAMRFAVDIKLRGIEELRHLFETVTPMEHIEAEPIDDDEAERILAETGMSHPTEEEFDPGDEEDVPLGVAGDIGVDLYQTGAPDDYLSTELDKMESRLSVDDKFADMAAKDRPSEADYASKYEQGKKLTEAQMKNGLLSMYPGDEGSVFDALDREDGLSDPKFDDDYEDYRTHEDAPDEPEEPSGASGEEPGYDGGDAGDNDDFADLGDTESGDEDGDDGEEGGDVQFGDFTGEGSEDDEGFFDYPDEEGPPEEDDGEGDGDM